MFVGNLLALIHRDIKRMLACSLIAHIGYLFLPLLAAGPEGVASIGFYLVAYFIDTVSTLATIAALSSVYREMQDGDAYANLAYQRS
jgi:NADH-quinone oxidoreductase subunit N